MRWLSLLLRCALLLAGEAPRVGDVMRCAEPGPLGCATAPCAAKG